MVQTIDDRCLTNFYFLASNFSYLNVYIKKFQVYKYFTDRGLRICGTKDSVVISGTCRKFFWIKIKILRIKIIVSEKENTSEPFVRVKMFVFLPSLVRD